MLDRFRKRFEPQISRLGGSDTAKAAGLAGAMVANNVIALGSVIVFSRELSDYGSLAALVSYFLILAVAGYAMQLATAREAVLGHLGVGGGMTATIRSWAKALLVFTLVVTVASRSAAAPDRRSSWRQAAMGGSSWDPGGLPLPVPVHHARVPPGPRRLPCGRHQPRRRTGDASADRRHARRRRLRRHRGLHRNPAVVRGNDVVLRGPLRRRARPPKARRPPSHRAVDSRAERVGPDRRARDHRGPPEHRHHRRQAPLLVRSRELLQRDRGGGEGPDLGRDGSRLLPGSRGVTPARGRRGRPSGARQGARDRRASRPCRAS